MRALLPLLALLVLLALSPSAPADHDWTGTRPIELAPREGPPALLWVLVGIAAGSATALLVGRWRRATP